MTYKEKAKEIFEAMSSQTYSYQPYAGAHYSTEEIGWEAGKKCSIIAVDQIIEQIRKSGEYSMKSQIEWWEKVKIEVQSF
jgi:hypothetical protein